MSVTPSPIGGFAAQFFDNNGVILSGGKIYTYAAGTTTPQATYTSAAGVTPHTNPIVLDSAGRVPGGEIWLTDSLIYKFVIETSTAILIGTYDNITGVNSNFVNYTVQEEVITATAGQTVFNLSTINYTPGTNSLSVYIDGVNQYVGDSYLETDSNTVTFTAGLHVGAEVKFTTAVQTTTGAVDASIVSYDPPFTGAVAQTVQTKLEQYVSVKDFGAVGDGVADDTAAINAAISYASTAINGATGMSVYFPTGTYLISSKITLPNRVGLQGANGRGTIIKPHSTFADSYMFHAVNGTSSMFGSWLRDMWIDARGKNMTAVVWSQAWQETCGMDRVLIQFDGTTQTGFLYTDGYGGAALLKLQDVEIFSNSSYSTVRGIRVNSVSLVGGFVLMVDNSTLAGDAVNKMDIGIDMVNDSLIATGVHGENIDGSILLMQGAGCLSADTITGSSTAVNDLVALGSGFTGKMHLRNMIPNGATGLTVNDDVTGRDIPASAGVIPEYVYQPSAFMATLSGNINNVTGNGTSYTVVFDNEIYDYLGEYDVATGQFVADRAGKYLFSCCLKLNVPVNSTTAVVRLNTSNRTYELYRGSFANQRDSSENVTVNGAMVVDLDDGDGASIEVVVQGIGADTVDVLASDGAVFSGEWISR